MNQLPTLHQTEPYLAIVKRIHDLSPDARRQWGKMSVSQMLNHCRVAIMLYLEPAPRKQMLIGKLMAWMFKESYLNQKPLAHDSPTDPSFVIVNEPNFQEEKSKLLSTLRQFHERGPEAIEGKVSPFFGKLTAYQIARMQLKHLDHHLRQFSA